MTKNSDLDIVNTIVGKSFLKFVGCVCPIFTMSFLEGVKGCKRKHNKGMVHFPVNMHSGNTHY